MKRQYRLWIIGIVAVLLVAAVAFTRGNPAGPEKTLALQAPAFLNSVSGASTGAPPEVVTLLSSEAGISAYIQTANPIILNSVRGQYRTIEAETADYIIGSVPIPDHPDHFDVHVYVHTDGWILAYYLNNETTSKIVNVKAGTISTTKLEIAISVIADAAGEAVTGLQFYDFRYPNATNILLVAEDATEGKDFTITLPTDYGYFDRSFAVYNTNAQSDGLDLYVDEVKVSNSWYYYEASYTAMSYGVVPASQLLPGQPHYIRLGYGNPYGALVIIYRVP